MIKITVLDNMNRFHSFQGNDMAFFTSQNGCEIVDFSKEKEKSCAFFSQYQWVKKDYVDNTPEPQSMTASDVAERRKKESLRLEHIAEANKILDRFEQADIEKRDNKPLDHNDLAPQKATDSDVKDLPDEQEGDQSEATQDNPEEEDAQLLLDEDIPDVDVDAVLAEAEKKHRERPPCETCGGAGTVPDDEAEDPLDTVMCPDC